MHHEDSDAGSLAVPRRVPPDGLDALRREIGVSEIASLIERTARWVAPETFRLLPVWSPGHGRGHPFYKGDWSEPQTNTKQFTGVSSQKFEGNIYANQALTWALGLRKADRPNWSCCHIWGVDDPAFQKANDVVRDRRFYSCIANMVLLPTPLNASTDTMPEIKAMLRICSRDLYGWTCDHHALAATVAAVDARDAWDDYPASWPRSPGSGHPPGMVGLTPDIERTAGMRRAAIARDLADAGPHYPRDEVRAVLAYWRIGI